MNKIFKIYKTFMNLVFYIVLFLIFLYVINIFICRYIYHEKVISFFNYYIFNVTTGSMEDSIHMGDYIIVKKETDFQIGDVVTYFKEDSFVTHRIVQIDGDTITTKGDANNTEDEPISKSDIIGKYVCRSTFIAFLMKYKIVIIELIVIFMIMEYLIDLFIQTNKKQQE